LCLEYRSSAEIRQLTVIKLIIAAIIMKEGQFSQPKIHPSAPNEKNAQLRCQIQLFKPLPV